MVMPGDGASVAGKPAAALPRPAPDHWNALVHCPPRGFHIATDLVASDKQHLQSNEIRSERANVVRNE